MEQLKISELYSDLNQTMAKELLESKTYPWEVLPLISEFILKLGNTLCEEEYEKRGENVWIAKSAKVAPTAFINGPAIIGKDAEVRHCAFIRGNALVGEGAVVGNSTELKNVILFNKVQVPHYNYVGDSILGFKSHMGAGSITSNVKSDKKLVVVKGAACVCGCFLGWGCVPHSDLGRNASGGLVWREYCAEKDYFGRAWKQ